MCVPAGELQQYVLEEVNVRSLQTSSDSQHYCSTRAEPVWTNLGQRLGKNMGKVAKAIKSLTAEQIADFESTGQLTLDGTVLQRDDIKVCVKHTCVVGPMFMWGQAPESSDDVNTLPPLSTVLMDA